LIIRSHKVAMLRWRSHAVNGSQMDPRNARVALIAIEQHLDVLEGDRPGHEIAVSAEELGG
jgi:hypothetical protein